MSNVFRDGMPHDLIQPMYEDGYAIQPGVVDPDFAAALFKELRGAGKYRKPRYRADIADYEPGVVHDSKISSHLGQMPRLKEYRRGLQRAVNDVSGFRRDHFTYLTVRSCPPGEMSTRIHRNDRIAGPWLVCLTVAGEGSFGVYDDSTIRGHDELALHGDMRDPTPLASSDMQTGDAWGLYSGEWSAPHAGGITTSSDPKVLVMLYGWDIRQHYPTGNARP